MTNMRITPFYIALVFILMGVLPGCAPTQVTPVTTPEPISASQTPTTALPTPTSIVDIGPEATPNPKFPYPTSVTNTEATAQLATPKTTVSETITQDPEVQELITYHTDLLRQSGLNVDRPNDTDYVHLALYLSPNADRWYIVPESTDGHIAGWLQIEDSSSLSGWRYGEQPTWSSGFTPDTMPYRFGLPNLHTPTNHFEVIFKGEFPILVEVTSTGEPQYWNNIAAKEMQQVEGATIAKLWKAGIPETMEECQSWELPINADGSLNEEEIAKEMKALSLVERAWLQEQGVIAADVQVFGANKTYDHESIPYTKMPIIKPYDIHGATSCTTVLYNGQEYMLYGFAGKRSKDSTQITLLHGIYDEIGYKNDAKKDGNLDYYNTHYTPELTFQNIKTATYNSISLFIKISYENPDLFDTWQLTHALIEAGRQSDSGDEQTIYQRLITHLMSEKYGLPTPTPEQEAEWIRQLESVIFPIQVISDFQL